MIVVRPAETPDAAAIGQVHVAAWRSAYPGILPDAFLSRLSVSRQATYYASAIRAGVGVHVAQGAGTGEIVGFVTDAPVRPGRNRMPLADGEVETLYVLDDWRERGLGRRLMQAAAAHLAAAGCGSAFVWVLRDNPSRWFYERLGGRPAAESTITVGGAPVVQTAYLWSPIERLVQATSAAS